MDKLESKQKNIRLKMILKISFLIIIVYCIITFIYSSLDYHSSEVNIAIKQPILLTFKFNWNGTNYSLYDSGFSVRSYVVRKGNRTTLSLYDSFLVLTPNLKNNSAFGENAAKVSEIKMHYQSEFEKYNATEWRFYDNVSSPCSRDKFGSDLNPTGDHVGGGQGYSRIVNISTAKYFVNDKNELLSALSAALSGDVIYVNDSAEINLTFERDLLIPSNVTLASGRGRANSKGALLFSKNFTREKKIYQLFVTGGIGVRITGIRIQGPDNETRNSAYEFPNSQGIYSVHDVEVDNSELSGWSHCAVCLYESQSNIPRIHHNYIHHNQRAGLGYGIVHGSGGNSIIEANIFDWNRHSIAGDGSINSSYTARYNLVLQNGTSHGFDMHGGTDRNDTTNIAGETINIYMNTFYEVSDENYPNLSNHSSYPAIMIRGIPTNNSMIHNNYLYYNSQDDAILQIHAFGNLSIFDNCYNGYLDNIASGAYTYYSWTSKIWEKSNSSDIETIMLKKSHNNIKRMV